MFINKKIKNAKKKLLTYQVISILSIAYYICAIFVPTSKVFANDSQIYKAPYLISITVDNVFVACGIIIDGHEGLIISHYLPVGYNYMGTLDNNKTFPLIRLDTLEANNASLFKAKTFSLLPEAPLADDNKLLLGETVFTVGCHPKAKQKKGIISALNRPFKATKQATTINLIQTDAEINQYNAGGALININGEVIGLNFFNKIKLEENSKGINFALPHPIIKKIKQNLKINTANATVSTKQQVLDNKSLKPSFSFKIKNLELNENQEKNSNIHWGVIITEIDPFFAQTNNLKKDDIIVSLNDTPIGSVEDYEKTLKTLQIGGSSWIEVIRNGESHMSQIIVAGE